MGTIMLNGVPYSSGSATDELSLTGRVPLQNKTVTRGMTDVLEEIGVGASQAYELGASIVCTNGKWYKAKTAIAQNDILVVNTNLTETSQREINSGLTQQLTANSIPFRFGYDSTRGKYGYIINEGGADTVIPFSSGGSYTKIEAQTTYNTTYSSKTFTVDREASGFLVAWGAQTQPTASTSDSAVGLNNVALTPKLISTFPPTVGQLNMRVMIFEESLHTGDEITVMFQLSTSFNYSTTVVAY